MPSRHPEYRVPVAVNVQHWRDLTFLHWPIEAARLQALIPPHLAVDIFEDAAWVSITPFRIQYFGAPEGAFALVPDFTEVNVRTYVRGEDGHDGVWFFSLECSRLPVTVLLRQLGLSYQRSTTDQRERDGAVQYTSRRRAGHGWFGAEVEAGERIEHPSPLENFLTGRWNGYSHAWGRIWRTPIEHEPWPLHTARARCDPAALFAENALPHPHTTPVVHFSPLVHVRIGMPRPV
ncbi:YqjF family protein [Pseudactinotalea sp. Z1739]|uniref:YqjF family protein n=1 Tax=Pseudactinotalea sp. Z1739 TaxID=3413028 RepID=UPI003C7996E9